MFMFIGKRRKLFNFSLYYYFRASYFSSLLQSIGPFSDGGLGRLFCFLQKGDYSNAGLENFATVTNTIFQSSSQGNV